MNGQHPLDVAIGTQVLSVAISMLCYFAIFNYDPAPTTPTSYALFRIRAKRLRQRLPLYVYMILRNKYSPGMWELFDRLVLFLILHIAVKLTLNTPTDNEMTTSCGWPDGKR